MAGEKLKAIQTRKNYDRSEKAKAIVSFDFGLARSRKTRRIGDWSGREEEKIQRIQFEVRRQCERE